MCFKIISNKWISNYLLLWMWLSEILRVSVCLQALYQTHKFTSTCNVIPYYTVTTLTGTYKEVTVSLNSLLLPCSTSTHSRKKWGIWEAPCREMLVFGGQFWNLERKCAFFVHKTYKLCLNWRLACQEIKFFSSSAYTVQLLCWSIYKGTPR